MTALNEPTTKLDAEIDAQKSRVANADRDLRKAKARLHQLQLDKARIEFGIVIGGVVKANNGTLHRIAQIEWSWQSIPWVHGHPQKKDGTFGTAIRNLHSDWTRPADTGNSAPKSPHP